MDDGITFDQRAFQAAMGEMAGQVPEIVARRALRAGGRIIQEAITERAPIRPPLPSGDALPPGALKSDIEVHVAKEGVDTVAAYIEPGRFTIRQARWVEYGHKRKGGEVIAHPFIRPGFESSIEAAWAEVQEAIATEVTAEAKKRGL